MVISSTLHGESGSLHWRETALDDALKIMDAFRACQMGVYKDGSFTSWRPADSLTFPLPEGHSFTVTEPFNLRLSGGMEYGQKVELGMVAQMGALRVRFAIELRAPHDVLPRIHYRTNVYQGRAVSIERGSQSVGFPLASVPAPSLVARYGAGSETALSDFMYSNGVADYIRAAVALLDARGAETLRAYQTAKAAATFPLPTRAEIDAAAESMRAAYAAKAGGLRTGTLHQTAALEMPAARADRALAEKHWARYAEDHGIVTTYRKTFDHYAWACDWLDRAGLLVDTVDGKPAKYGAAWY
jgi:hypothetical protein